MGKKPGPNQTAQQKARAEYMANWYAKLSEEKKLKIYGQHRAYAARMKEGDEETARWMWARQSFFNAKCRSKRYGVEFSLKLSDIEMPLICPVLNVPLDYRARGRGGAGDYSPSLDRMDNNKGYITGNVRTVSRRANTLKNNSTDARELIAVARYMQGGAARPMPAWIG